MFERLGLLQAGVPMHGCSESHQLSLVEPAGADSSAMAFDGGRFRSRVARALTHVRSLLENGRLPQLAHAMPHAYDDKFGLAEGLAALSAAAALHTLQRLGLDADRLQGARAAARSRTVTLRLSSVERCEFDREEERQATGPY